MGRHVEKRPGGFSVCGDGMAPAGMFTATYVCDRAGAAVLLEPLLPLNMSSLKLGEIMTVDGFFPSSGTVAVPMSRPSVHAWVTRPAALTSRTHMP